MLFTPPACQSEKTYGEQSLAEPRCSFLTGIQLRRTEVHNTIDHYRGKLLVVEVDRIRIRE